MDLLSIRWRVPRRSQDVPEHNQYPITPAVSNLYPAWQVQIAFTRNLTNRKTRTNPELNVYPAAIAVGEPIVSWETKLNPTNNATNRRLQTDLGFEESPAPDCYYSAIISKNPQAYWRLGESVTIIPAHEVIGALDADGTYSNVTVGATGIASTKGNTAASFAGVSLVEDCGDSSDFNFIHETGIFTIEVWGKPTSVGISGSYTYLGNNLSLSSNGFTVVYSGTDDKVRIIIYDGSGATVMCDLRSSAALITNGTYHHLLITGDGTTCKIYVNNALVGSTAFGAKPTGNAGNPLYLGASNPGGGSSLHWDGDLDEIAIYDYELTQAERTENYNKGALPGTAKPDTELKRFKLGRSLLNLPELNVYPATPAGYYTGYYPGPDLVLSNRSKFEIRAQLVPELNTYPSVSVVSPVTAWELHFEQVRNKTNRKLLSVLEHDQYPVTPAVTPPLPAYYDRPALRHQSKYKLVSVPEHNSYPVFAPLTAYIERPSFKHRSKYSAKAVPEHNEFPATPAGFYSGYFPGSGLASSIKTSFKLKHKTVPELNVYPAAPVLTDPVVSWVGHFEQTKNATNRRLLRVELDRYPAPTITPTFPDFGVGAILNADAFGVAGSMDSDGFGVVGALDSDSFGASGILNDGEFGVKGSLDSDAFGVIGSLGD